VEGGLDLTVRELQILELVALGYSQGSGARIEIAPRTVECHIDTMRLKMRARNRTHMVAIAIFLELLNGERLQVTATGPGGSRWIGSARRTSPSKIGQSISKFRKSARDFRSGFTRSSAIFDLNAPYWFGSFSIPDERFAGCSEPRTGAPPGQGQSERDDRRRQNRHRSPPALLQQRGIGILCRSHYRQQQHGAGDA
jgi:DNA-binding CsgD family transcriptional regulator